MSGIAVEKLQRLHIEVIRTVSSTILAKDLSELVQLELKKLDKLAANTIINNFSVEGLKENIVSITICELETYGNVSDDFEVQQSDVKLVLHIYRLHDGSSRSEVSGGDSGDGPGPVATYWTLPSLDFHKIWESLVFDDDIKHRLVRYASTLAVYSSAGVDQTVISSNRIVLLHGPPGTGKTTLCKAVAQKLSIRLSSRYKHTVLVEINAHSLFSKYFSESGKLVVAMFSRILELVEDPSTLVCLLVDEVESLTHCRKSASSTAEPSDAVRVVNAVLTQLDIIKQHPNVITLSTSNISKSVDEAFMDRADIKFFIGLPSQFALYMMFRSIIMELLRVDLVSGEPPLKVTQKKIFEEYVGKYIKTSFQDDDSIDNDPTWQLVSLAILAERSGMSGRAVRKLPILCHSLCLPVDTSVSIQQFIEGLRQTIKMVQKLSMELE